MTPDEIADILESAADDIQQHGWFQDFYYPPSGGFGKACPKCISGAIAEALQMDAILDDIDGTFTSWQQIMDKCVAVASYTGNLFQWNDNTKRTKEEILDLLRETAVRFRLGEMT